MPTTKLTHDIIHAAIRGYEIQKTGLDAKIAELRALLSGDAPKRPAAPAVTAAAGSRKSRRLSAAGRKAISEAARKRWAEFHAAKKKTGA